MQIRKCLQIPETITRYRSKFDTIFEKVDTTFIDRSNKFSTNDQYLEVVNKIVKQKVSKIRKILNAEKIEGYCINCYAIKLTGAKYSTNTKT